MNRILLVEDHERLARFVSDGLRGAGIAVDAVTVETGPQPAMLTDANPLDGLATLEHPVGVMANGRWYDAAELRALLDGVAAKYATISAQPQ